MQSKKIALAVLASAFMSTTALAQATPPADKPQASPPSQTMTAPAAAPAGSAVVPTAQGKWRASKLIGVNVYNAANERIGDINELITDSSGNIDIVVVGVGGFLGIGQHNVGIKFDQVKFSEQPRQGATTGTGSTAATTTRTNPDYPDHAVVNMTKDQLKEMPAFKYASDTASASDTRPATSPAPAARPAAPATPPAAPANPPAR